MPAESRKSANARTTCTGERVFCFWVQEAIVTRHPLIRGRTQHWSAESRLSKFATSLLLLTRCDDKLHGSCSFVESNTLTENENAIRRSDICCVVVWQATRVIVAEPSTSNHIPTQTHNHAHMLARAERSAHTTHGQRLAACSPNEKRARCDSRACACVCAERARVT